MDAHQYAIKAPLIMVKSVFFFSGVLIRGLFAFSRGHFATAKAAVEAVILTIAA